jgi:hypothetical protein
MVFSLYFFFYFIDFFLWPWGLTQDLTLAMQALPYLSHTPALVALGNFSGALLL